MRPTWDQYYMEMAEVAKKRSTCNRRQVGAVIVKNQRILASGYNGAPSGITHCDEAGCLRAELKVPSGERHELCRGLHAEQNAIIQAALHGVGIKDSTIYVTHMPCIICTKMMINAGIKKLIYKGDYPDSLSEQMLQEAGMIVEKYTEDEK